MVAPGVNARPDWRDALERAALVLLWGAIGVGALLLLAKSVQNSGEFGRLQPWILLLNIIGRDRAQHAAGAQAVAARARLSRARARLAAHGAHGEHFRRAGGRAAAHRVPVLAGIPESRHRQLVQGRGEAGARAMRWCCRAPRSNLRMREYSARTEQLAHSLAAAPAGDDPGAARRRAAREQRASRSSLFGEHERIIAASIENPLETLPSRPPSDLVRQIARAAARTSSLEPQADGEYLIRTAAPLQ